MTEYKFKANDVMSKFKSLDGHLSSRKPNLWTPSPRDVYDTGCDTFQGVINAVGVGDKEISFDIPSPPDISGELQRQLTAAQQTIDQLRLQLDHEINTVTRDLQRRLTDALQEIDRLRQQLNSIEGSDPLQALQRIAEALNQAESKLNEQNLVVATANVKADLDLNLGVAGAHATITFDVQPKPYN